MSLSIVLTGVVVLVTILLVSTFPWPDVRDLLGLSWVSMQSLFLGQAVLTGTK